MIYLDSSAITKLVRREPETRALLAYLRTGPDRVTSVLSTVEVNRAVRRLSRRGRELERARRVLAAIDQIELDEAVRSRAIELEPAQLRTLDAIHLGTALTLGSDLEAFVTYDMRQAEAAAAIALGVVSPGAS